MEPDDIDCKLIAADEALWSAKVGLHREVLAARDAGLTWTAIAEVLGVTRQSAQERFGRRQPERRGGRQPAKPVQVEALW